MMTTARTQLTAQQQALAALPADRKIFLEGIAGTGKTTAAVARLEHLLRSGVPGSDILVILPQRTLAAPYQALLRSPDTPAGGEVTLVTVGGLGQRMIELYWPLIAGPAGFAQPDRPPVFLTLETAQYFMARIVRPMLEAGAFDAVRVERNRLYSQVLDNLNKAAVVGFDPSEIGPRLKAASLGDSVQLRVYDEAQEAASRFRAYCLAHNLLDFSLQMEVFARHLWPLRACREYLMARYRHLVIDNVEEDTPVAHDILLDWLPHASSACVVYDAGGGYRRFLGADPASGYRLKALCDEPVQFEASFVTSPAVQGLSHAFRRALRPKPRAGEVAPTMGRNTSPLLAEELDFDAPPGRHAGTPEAPAAAAAAGSPAGSAPPWLGSLEVDGRRYYHQMLDWVADRIAVLVHDEGVPPGEIAVVAPFVGGGLRFSLENRLAQHGVAVRSHRPSRALREEPATLCLLTWAALCHPAWRIRPTPFDVAQALMLTIADMDLVRAQLLADIAYRTRDGVPVLTSFADIEPAMQERITFLLGGRYEGLRTWLGAHTVAAGATAAGAAAGDAPQRGGRTRGARARGRSELDHFLARLFGELLSQPGYGFHASFDAGEVTAKVIESARKFRQAMAAAGGAAAGGAAAGGAATGGAATGGAAGAAGGPLGREYVELVHDGVVAAQYVRSWQRQPQDAVLIAPAYTFLMSNAPVDHQFWLDIGATGWWERLNQPLTHPYILSRRWESGAGWTDFDEYLARQEAMAELVIGLVHRCRRQIHLGISELSESGSDQRGTLLRTVQHVLRAAQPPRQEP